MPLNRLARIQPDFFQLKKHSALQKGPFPLPACLPSLHATDFTGQTKSRGQLSRFMKLVISKEPSRVSCSHVMRLNQHQGHLYLRCFLFVRQCTVQHTLDARGWSTSTSTLSHSFSPSSFRRQLRRAQLWFLLCNIEGPKKKTI